MNTVKEEKKVRGHISEVDPDFSKLGNQDNPTNFIRLDLACGNNKQDGFIGVDFSSDTQADWLCNLEAYPWKYTMNGPSTSIPLYENVIIPYSSVSEIFCSHYIEHVSDLKAFAAEIYRILIPNGRVTFIAPYYTSIRAMQDLTHLKHISEATFLYWNKTWIDTNKLSHYNMNCNFNIMSCKFRYAPEWNVKSDEAKEFGRKHYWNVVEDIEVVLKAIKE